MQPDEQALCTDLSSATFFSGEDRGRWTFRTLEWPYLYVDIIAHNRQPFTLRLDCSGYPMNPPTGTFWDLSVGCRLAFDKWPTGGERIQLALRHDWKNGDALYIPCDRESIVGHDAWVSQYPQMIWNPDRGITMYLEVVHNLLQSCDNVCTVA